MVSLGHNELGWGWKPGRAAVPSNFTPILWTSWWNRSTLPSSTLRKPLIISYDQRLSQGRRGQGRAISYAKEGPVVGLEEPGSEWFSLTAFLRQPLRSQGINNCGTNPYFQEFPNFKTRRVYSMVPRENGLNSQHVILMFQIENVVISTLVTQDFFFFCKSQIDNHWFS